MTTRRMTARRESVLFPRPQDSARRYHARPDGFTLLEVLIVLAMLLFGFAVVAELMNGSLRQADDAEERTEIQLVCQNTLNEIAAGARQVIPGAVEIVPLFPRWTIQTFIEETRLHDVVAVSVIAQKYETRHNVPVDGKQIVLRQWMIRDAIRNQIAPAAFNPDTDPFSFGINEKDEDLFRDAGFSEPASDENESEEVP